MIILEITQSEIALDWILKYKNNYKNYVFYSFWSNFLLLTFKKLKEDKNIKTISRVLGSDLNGFIKDDDFVPFIDIKFITLDKIILLGDYQKDKLNKYNLDKKIEIVPLGVFQQNNNINNKIDLNEPLIFISCGNLIEIKNNLLMINFLEKFLKQTNKKVKYIMIGNGILKNKILNKIKVNSNIIFEYHEYVDNFVNFLKKNKVHFFLNFSSQEGMAFTIMESMSCGIPAITSDIPPNRYLVNTNGFLIDLKNYKDSINHVISNINQTIDNKEDYYLKSKRSFNFINENLINSKCYDKFELILKKI
jgi:glycosyltransferase involved in cell wall biosynthesis